jgi:Uma2 family endonuclease
MVQTSPQEALLPIPPLKSGDRLARYEFEHRYQAMPQLKKAELIEGIVYMPAALRFKSHGQPHARIMAWLVVYETATPGVEVGDNPTVRLDLNNEPQPDAVLLISEQAGGQSRLSEDDYLEGAPELIVEIAASSVAIDLHDKKRAYQRNGVQEYLVWQVHDQKLEWFYLQAGEYHSLSTDNNGVMRSQFFPGLWLAADDLLTGNMARVLAVLQEGLASPEHTVFVQQLLQL